MINPEVNILHGKLFNRGTVSVWFLADTRGNCQAADYLLSLDGAAQDKARALLDRVAPRGTYRNEQKFRNLGDGIWEFKSGQARLLCFQMHGGYVITHAVDKPKSRALLREKRKALRLRDQFRESGEVLE